ncbi:DUF2059 domain-containing protein [Derxia gummosa]|uniref:DUF2059 domain-containing protein n=1 Tax=Derxia gummosa DSM 723 TaxID=1121388 RepID=A0A8B6X4U3_9BURK|nr:DUF2059 domain-containing protein [Derxia gummosa]
MKQFALALALASACTLTFAAPPSTESIEQLLIDSQIEEMFGKLQAQTRQQSMQTMAATFQQISVDRTKLTAEQRATLDKLPERLNEIVFSEMNWATLRPIFVRIYQESFEQEEIDGMSAFYQSPVGKAMLAKMPQTMMKTEEQLAPVQIRIQQRLRDEVSRFVLELRNARS